MLAWLKLFSIIEWWVHVTVTPDERSTIVFSRGIWNGLKGVTPMGGQRRPISTLGDSLLWKNAQKNDKKKKISDTINKIIPHFIPVTTLNVCSPWNVLSRETSRHHWYDVIIKINNPKSINSICREWNHFTNPDVRVRAPIEAVIGHGLLIN